MKPLRVQAIVIGIAPDRSDLFERMTGNRLRAMNPELSLVAHHCRTFEDVTGVLAQQPEIEVVYFANMVDRTECELRKGAALVIEAFATYPNNPSVGLSVEVEHLEHLFQAVNIATACATLESVICLRLQKQETERAA